MKEIYEKLGLFYLGKDSKDESLTLYKSKHLTTHAMLVGMTGSGKTGLGITLIEEAAIDNIPSIIIDPKGDMANLCLAFPKMEAKDFEPWVDAPNAEIDKAILAEQTARMWENGLSLAHQDKARVEKFARVDKSVYTPGSSAGIGVNILASFNVPSREVLDDSDTLSSLINTTVSSLLALIGVKSESINAKEHLLLSNILYHFWTQEISLTLEDIVGYVALPPFKKIGMLAMSSFYNQEERMKLAMLLNGVISSVTFSSWIEGEALDIQNMLYDEQGNAKIAIFSIAHLSDDERMFFVTILLNSYISWMRRQRGSESLKTILYMDEIFGFFPPIKNPPSKEPMLLLLKQARAFGTGVILSTQNPVDIDYKGLSNIGTWFIGKLQTKQDIEKVIDGIAAKSELGKEELVQKIATLAGRHFFMKNVHEEQTREFSTRWVLSYLKGPMTKDDIRFLMRDKKSKSSEIKEQKSSATEVQTAQKPILCESIKEYFLDTNINATTPFYPYIYANVKVRFFNQKLLIDKSEDLYFKIDAVDFIEKAECLEDEKLHESYVTKQIVNAEYASLPSQILEAKNLNIFEKKLTDCLYESKNIELFVCKALHMESTLGTSRRDFMVEVQNRLKELRDEKAEKLKDKFEESYERLEERMQRFELQLQKEKEDVSSKTTETIIDIGLTVLGAFFGRKALSASTMRGGASAFKKGQGIFKEKSDVQNVKMNVQSVQADMQELSVEFEEAIQKIEDELNMDNYEIQSFFIKPKRSDIVVQDIALLWER